MRRLLTVAALAATASMFVACWVEPDPGQPAPPPSQAAGAAPAPTSTTPGSSSTTTPETRTIAAGETLSSNPGEGAGIFVEYWGDGQWYVWATCDTDRAGRACLYTLKISGEKASKLTSPQLSPADRDTSNRVTTGDGTVIAVFTTTSEADGVKFRADPPGAGIELDASLDGEPAQRFVYWVGPDVLHTGAPTNPIKLVPDRPLAQNCVMQLVQRLVATFSLVRLAPHTGHE